MELKDTIEMMNSSDFKERFKAEYYQLKNRITDMTIMLNNYWGNRLQHESQWIYYLLCSQLAYMESYRDILERRAKIENIEL